MFRCEEEENMLRIRVSAVWDVDAVDNKGIDASSRREALWAPFGLMG